MPPPAFSSSLRMKRPIYGDNGLREASNQRHESSHPTKPHQAQPPPKPPDPPKPPNPSNLPCPPTVLHTVEELDRTHGPGPDEQDEEDQARQLARQQARYDDRSLVFRGLSSTTELLDITSAIRGGAILSVHLKPRDRTAHVSFVDSTAAHEFCVWAKRNDIYIKDKRVCVRKRLSNKVPDFANETLLRLLWNGMKNSCTYRNILHVRSKSTEPVAIC